MQVSLGKEVECIERLNGGGQFNSAKVCRKGIQLLIIGRKFSSGNPRCVPTLDFVSVLYTFSFYLVRESELIGIRVRRLLHHSVIPSPSLQVKEREAERC